MGKGKDKKVTKNQQIEFWKYGINPILGYRLEPFTINSEIETTQTPLEYKHLDI
ncbi:hypothetical protein ACIVBQ_000573 [Tenacibaculum discolor]